MELTAIRKSKVLGALAHGNYFVEPYGLDYKIYLDRDATLYGNPSAVQPDSEVPGITRPADAKYLHELGFGEFYQDAISKIAAVYGMEWGVNRFAYPYLKTLDIPRTFFNDREGENISGGGPPS